MPTHQWRSQPKSFGEAKMFNFRRITLLFGIPLSKRKMTIYTDNLGGKAPFPPGYAYVTHHVYDATRSNEQFAFNV